MISVDRGAVSTYMGCNYYQKNIDNIRCVSDISDLGLSSLCLFSSSTI